MALRRHSRPVYLFRELGQRHIMKTLYLLRHAKSSWAIPGQKDFDRPLNGRGMRDAPAMGARMCEHGFEVDLVVSSPAVRALSTAYAVCAELGLSPDSIVQDRQIYLAGSAKLLQLISLFDESKHSALIVAHNPALTDLANELARASIDNIPTSGLVSIALPIQYWAEVLPGVGKVLDFDFPKNPE
jgi:phosphohistidine phosphatase